MDEATTRTLTSRGTELCSAMDRKWDGPEVMTKACPPLPWRHHSGGQTSGAHQRDRHRPLLRHMWNSAVEGEKLQHLPGAVEGCADVEVVRDGGAVVGADEDVMGCLDECPVAQEPGIHLPDGAPPQGAAPEPHLAELHHVSLRGRQLFQWRGGRGGPPAPECAQAAAAPVSLTAGQAGADTNMPRERCRQNPVPALAQRLPYKHQA